MRSYLRVREQREEYVTLSESQLSLLQKNLGEKIELTPTEEEHRYRLRAGSHVGFVVLPENNTLIIEPKISVQTILFLLSLVYDPGKEFFREDEQPFTTTEGLFEYIVSIFISHTEDLIARGILRGYRIRDDNLNIIRGRLLFPETIHRRPVVRDRHWCCYSDFTADILENIIIHSTSYFLRAYQYQDKKIYGRISRLDRSLAEVSIDPEPKICFENLTYHRLNDHYRPALYLAKLLLDHITFSGSEGKEPFLAFIIDMDWLFEKVVWAIIHQNAYSLGVNAREQMMYSLDMASHIRVKPDVILYRDHSPALVIDTKYKLDPHQSDVYQVLAYCHALGIEQAVLVHPDSEKVPSTELRIKKPGNVNINYLKLDLSGTPSEILVAAGMLVEDVRKILASN